MTTVDYTSNNTSENLSGDTTESAPCSTSCDKENNADWAANKVLFSLIWGLPLALAISAFWLPTTVAGGLWLLSFSWMGGACLVNARRCGRVHCHFTAAWLLSIAVGLLLAVTSVLVMMTAAQLAVTGLAGFGIIWLVSEQLWGRYFGTENSH